MKLTDRQKDVLAELARHRGAGRSCTNATLCALERRGLVKLNWRSDEEYPNVQLEHWTVTDLGFEQLSH